MRLDIPLKHPIGMSFGSVETQNTIIVRIEDSDGAWGVGEVTILGGPFWGAESAESVQAAIEVYIAPLLLGARFDSVDQFAAHIARLVKGNAGARSALEIAMLDLCGRKNDVSAAHLFGGVRRNTIPVTWTLSTGSTERDIAEGERALAEYGFRQFKLKFGIAEPEQDVARAVAILRAFEGRASVIADVNQAWSLDTAMRALPVLRDAGLTAIEQPLPSDELEGAATLQNDTGFPLIADEALVDPWAAKRIMDAEAARYLSLKPSRDGGPLASLALAGEALSRGLGLYGGSAMETSLGTAASALLYGSVETLHLGTELFGPMRLVHDIVEHPLVVANGCVILPTGPGLGISLDNDLVTFLSARKQSHHLAAVTAPDLTDISVPPVNGISQAEYPGDREGLQHCADSTALSGAQLKKGEIS